MKITDVQIDGFGVWSELQINDLSDRLTVFYGPNEAGKTTLLQFIRSVLYGMSPPRWHRYLPPLRGGRPGGGLHVALPEGRFFVRRHADPDHPGAGHVSVTTEDGTAHDEPLLTAVLKDVDEATFNNVFAIGLRELQELGTLSDTDAATWLYSLTAGLDRVSLVEVMRELEAARDRILAVDDRPGEVSRLLAERTRLQKQLDDLPSMAGRWADVSRRRVEIQQRIAGLETERDRLGRDARLLETALQVKDKWHRRASIDRQLAAADVPRTLPPDGMDRLQRLAERYARHRRGRDKLLQEIHRARAEAKRRAGSERFLRQASRIEALGEQRQWVAALEDQLRSHEQEVAGLTSRLDSERQRLGAESAATSAELTETARRAVPMLKRPARSLRSARQELHAAQQSAATCREAAVAVAAEIGAELAARPEQDLTTAVENAGHLAAQLRRRVDLDERLDQMARHQAELEKQGRATLEQQLLPFWILASLGTLFIMGVVMMLSGLWFPTSILGPLGRALAVLGVLGTATSGLIKYLLERSVASRLHSYRTQIDLLGRQVDEAKQEREALNQRLPSGGGPLTRRLQEAQRELEALERLLPLEAKSHEAKRAAACADEALPPAQRQLDAASAAWRRALAAAGLPADMTPAQVRDLMRRADQLVGLRTRVEGGNHDLALRRREYESLTQRIRRLAADLGMPTDDCGAGELLQQLLRQWELERPNAQRRAQLRRRLKWLRRRVPRHERAMKRLVRQRDALLAQTGVSKLQQYRQLALKEAHITQLQRERDALDQEIRGAIGSQASENDVAGCYAEDSIGPLETRCADLAQRLSQNESQLAQCLAERGALGQEQKELAGDRRRAEKRLELSVVQQRLRDALEAWQVRAIAWMLLDEIRREYEQQRQPETLVEASDYLRSLTQERYVKVWTPLSEDALYINDARGETLPVEVLSRGTREQLFLCLRLALVSFYARQGVQLPLVLDDVLVNFDARRAKAAARLLRDFAKGGHQLLVFTCHEHVWKMFKSMRVDARRLPAVADPATVGAADPVYVETVSIEEQQQPAAAVEPEEIPDEWEDVEDFAEGGERPQAGLAAGEYEDNEDLDAQPAGLGHGQWVRVGAQVRRRDMVTNPPEQVHSEHHGGRTEQRGTNAA